jgi:hypothetical protein
MLCLATLVFALVLTTSAFPEQRDAGTDRFLSTLPVRPWRIFAARALACAAVLSVVVVSRHVFFLSRHALLGDWAPGFLFDVGLPLALVELFASAVALGLALAAAHWRRLGVILMGVVVLVLRLAVDKGGLPPECDVLGLAAPTLANAVVLLPSAAWVVGWLSAAAFGAWWGFTLFRNPKDPLGSLDRALRRGVAVPRVANASLALLGLVLPAALFVPEIDAGPELVTYPSQSVSSLTKHYRFTYLARDSDRFRALVGSADELYELIVDEVGSPEESGEPIEVALTPAFSGVDPRWYGYTLARLTSERLVKAQTAGRLWAWGSAGRVLREGVCRNVASRVSGGDAFGSRFHVAILHSRQPLSLDDVFDSSELVNGRGAEAAAPLGDAFVDALREVHGAEAVVSVLRGVRELPARSAPDSVDQSHELWRDLAKAAGLDTVKLGERLVEIIEDAVYGDARAQIALPRLDVAMETTREPAGRRILAVPDQDLPEGWTVVCRVRRAAPGEPEASPIRSQSFGADRNGCHVFFVRTNPFDTPPWIQLGLRAVDALPTLGTIWESWTAPNGAP